MMFSLLSAPIISWKKSGCQRCEAPWRLCDVVPNGIYPHPEPLSSIDIDSSTFADDWLTAFKDQRYTDVTFLLGSGTKMKAHKIVLCAGSAFFASLIDSNIQRKVSYGCITTLRHHLHVVLSLQHIQCGAIVTRSLLSKITTNDTP